MAATGPVPKRDDDRIRRNKQDAADKIEVSGPVMIPILGIPDVDPMVQDLYDSLSKSAQKQFYEPSDWQYLRLACRLLDEQFKSGRKNGQILTMINSMLSESLVSEGSRRRVRLEIERSQGDAVQDDTKKYLMEALGISASRDLKQRWG